LHVTILQRVSTHTDACVTYLGAEELTQEIAVYLLYVAIDDPDLVPVPPLAGPLSPKLASVGLGRLQFDDSAWLSFINVISLCVVTLRVAVDQFSSFCEI
jgi:hypothetical protein